MAFVQNADTHLLVTSSLNLAIPHVAIKMDVVLLILFKLSWWVHKLQSGAQLYLIIHCVIQNLDWIFPHVSVAQLQQEAVNNLGFKGYAGICLFMLRSSEPVRWEHDQNPQHSSK